MHTYGKPVSGKARGGEERDSGRALYASRDLCPGALRNVSSSLHQSHCNQTKQPCQNVEIEWLEEECAYQGTMNPWRLMGLPSLLSDGTYPP